MRQDESNVSCCLFPKPFPPTPILSEGNIHYLRMDASTHFTSIKARQGLAIMYRQSTTLPGSKSTFCSWHSISVQSASCCAGFQEDVEHSHTCPGSHCLRSRSLSLASLHTGMQHSPRSTTLWWASVLQTPKVVILAMVNSQIPVALHSTRFLTLISIP